MPHRFIAYIILIFVCALTPVCQAQAVEQRLLLEDFVIDNSDGRLTLRFGVGVAEPEQMRILLKGGGSLRLTCVATLKDSSSFWYDSTLTENTLVMDISHDALTSEYVLHITGQDAPYRSKGLKSLLAETWSKLQISLGQVSALQRDNDYAVNLSVTLEKTDVPPWLSKTFFFWSWDAAPSMQYSMRFTF